MMSLSSKKCVFWASCLSGSLTVVVLLWFVPPAGFGHMKHLYALVRPDYVPDTTKANYIVRPDGAPFLDPRGPGQYAKPTAAETLKAKLSRYENKIYRVDSPEERCTFVAQTYKREQILDRLIKHYCSMPIFHKVLIVWNDVNTSIPESLTNGLQSCSSLVQFVVPDKNLLTNRFVPREEIETDCKLYSVNSFDFSVWITSTAS